SADYQRAQLIVIVALLAGLAFGVTLALLVAARIVRPLRSVSRALTAVADGDLNQRVEVRSRDEVGEMATAVNDATASVPEAVGSLARGADLLKTSSGQLTVFSDEIFTSADQASMQAQRAAHAADQVSANVRTVAAGTEQMEESIREIASNANDGAKVASHA